MFNTKEKTEKVWKLCNSAKAYVRLVMPSQKSDYPALVLRYGDFPTEEKKDVVMQPEEEEEEEEEKQ